jgi:hypothetical protein
LIRGIPDVGATKAWPTGSTHQCQNSRVGHSQKNCKIILWISLPSRENLHNF